MKGRCSAISVFLCVFILLFAIPVFSAQTFPAPSDGYYENGNNGHLTYFTSGQDMGNNGYHLVSVPPGGNGGAGGQGGLGGNANNSNTNNANNSNSNSNRNDNTNLNYNSNKNTNVQGQGQFQGQQQGQAQKQGQSQAVNNQQTIAPSQNSAQSIQQTFEAIHVAPGMGREFAQPQGAIWPTMVRPNDPKIPQGFVPASYLPKSLTFEEASRLSKGGKSVTSISNPMQCQMGSVKVVNGKGEAKNFVTGYSEVSAVAAWGAALKAAMDTGACSSTVEMVSQGVTSTPSSFFIGLGSSFTQSQLTGSEKDYGMTSGGSGLIGYSRASQSSVFFYTFAIYQ